MKKYNSFIHRKFNHFIDDNNVFTENNSILAAISGGQDSICLLKLLKDYNRQQKKIAIHVIHFDHGWRSDSSKNAAFLKKIVNRWKLTFHYKKSNFILSEEDARLWRYSTMKTICEELEIKYIVTGHTYNDRLETIFFNIIKGSGFEGVQAIQPHIQISNKINLIHPLLNTTREETLWFCRKFFLPIWSDTTNYNQNITRNRIREELIPYCKQYFNLNLEGSLFRFIENVNCDLDYLQERTYYLYYRYKHPKYIGINRSAFSTLSYSMKKRLIRVFIYHNTNIKLNFLDTQKYVSFIGYKKVQVIQLSLIWYLCISNKWIYLLSDQAKKHNPNRL